MFKTKEDYYGFFDSTYLGQKEQIEEIYGQDYEWIKESTCEDYFRGLRQDKHSKLIPGNKYLSSKGQEWIALKIDQKTWEKGDINVPSPGTYLFYGMWYGDDSLDPKSYGKVVKEIS